jgi:hypothetical protein
VSVSQGTGITNSPNPIVTAGTVNITNTGVSAGSYQLGSFCVTFNAQGQTTNVVFGSCSGGTFAMLINTGSKLLIQTGSALLIQ